MTRWFIIYLTDFLNLEIKTVLKCQNSQIYVNRHTMLKLLNEWPFHTRVYMKNIKLKHHNTLCYDIEIARVEIQKEQVRITHASFDYKNSICQYYKKKMKFYQIHFLLLSSLKDFLFVNGKYMSSIFVKIKIQPMVPK